MPVELLVPHVGESIYEVTIGEWLKGEGELVRADEPVVALETDKASLDVPAPTAGRLVKLLKRPGESAQVGEAIAVIEADVGAAAAAPAQMPTPGAPVEAQPGPSDSRTMTTMVEGDEGDDMVVMPAARRLLERHALRPQDITPTGPGRRLLKEDVLRHMEQMTMPPAAQAPTPAPAPGPGPVSRPTAAPPGRLPIPFADGAERAREEVVPMTPLRRRIAERLVQSQQEAALLTTFNEVDMSAVFALRNQYKDSFAERHGVKLGFMSFFVKATIEALKEMPALNAEIRGADVVYKHYYHIGVAVGGGKGLLVPVIRDADRLSFAEIELTIRDFAVRAQKGKIRPEELQGGTFTISNGGVYGSLLSTPIVNPPQVGILGMHNVQERPVVRDGAIVARPMMYVAMSYDHRLVDGRESVTFLRRIKDCVENPTRILLEV
ncbi:MAG: 2-oxoglutarate dehydrogenase complex dihydrolipoyllysine-residue succinyltransferase [Planctomycetota bacterium]